MQPVVNVFVNNDPVVTSNKYGCLNSSVHGNEATPGGPPKQQLSPQCNSCNGGPQLHQPHHAKHHPRRRLFDCHDESEEDRASSPHGVGPTTTKGKKRSKSTSPTRHRSAGPNQRDLYRNINPDTATWQQKQ